MDLYKVIETKEIGEDLFISLGQQEDREEEQRLGDTFAEATTITMPIRQRNTELEDAIQVMTRQFTETVKALAMDKPGVKKRVTNFQQTFGGEKHEDPEVFLRKLERYFERAEIEEEEDKITIFEGQLRGEAKIWRTPYQKLEETYNEICQKFLQHFNSADRISAAMSALYGEKQKEEKVISFIINKQGLIARLVPEMGSRARVDLILNQLNSEIRSRLRGARFETIEELTSAATNVEEDLNAGSYVRKNSGNFRKEEGDPGQRKTPPNPCRYCGEWHYHSECKKNPYKATSRPEERKNVGRSEENWN